MVVDLNSSSVGILERGIENVDGDNDVDDDIYIMMRCLSVTKNHHFLLGVSCDHLNYP